MTTERRAQMSSALQAGSVVVAIALAFAAVQFQTSANTAAIADHEARMRTLERDVLAGLTRIDQRLTAIERGLP